MSLLRWSFVLIVLLKCVVSAPSGQSANEYNPLLGVGGTVWCGSGNKAADLHDLGAAGPMDACCRDHDRCKWTIPAQQTKWKHHNWSSNTLLHCICEEKYSLSFSLHFICLYVVVLTRDGNGSNVFTQSGPARSISKN